MYQKNRDKFYQAALRHMVEKALAEKHRAFAAEHQSDSDEQLAAYIRSCAGQLHHTPHEGEIFGTPLILERFESWDRAMHLAGLIPNLSKPKQSKFRIVQQETAYQQLHYRENRDKLKQEKAQRASQRKAAQSKGN